MFTYVCLGTNDLTRAAKFYDAALGVLGIRRCDTSDEPEWQGTIGWGVYEDHGARELALWLTQPFNKQPATAGNGTMVALRALSWDQVDQFYATALEHGGKSEGAPGLRPQYN